MDNFFLCSRLCLGASQDRVSERKKSGERVQSTCLRLDILHLHLYFVPGISYDSRRTLMVIRRTLTEKVTEMQLRSR